MCEEEPNKLLNSWQRQRSVTVGDEFKMWLSRCLEGIGGNWEPEVWWKCLFLFRYQMSFLVQSLLGATGSSIVESGLGSGPSASPSPQ